VLGAVGGGESSVLITDNLPPYTPSGVNESVSVTVDSTEGDVAIYGGGGNPGLVGSAAVGMGLKTLTSTGNVPGQIFVGTAQGGKSAPLRTMPPTITCNYIIRVL
jgi:hypothetical protein